MTRTYIITTDGWISDADILKLINHKLNGGSFAKAVEVSDTGREQSIINTTWAPKEDVPQETEEI